MEKAISQAARNSHLELVKYLISRISIDKLINSNILYKALVAGANGQSREIIDYLITLSNNLKQENYYCDFPALGDLANALNEVARVGKIDLFNYILSLVGSLDNLPRALAETIRGGNIKIIEHIFDIDPTLKTNFILNGGLYLATKNGQKQTMDYFLKSGSDWRATANDIDKILSGAASSDNKELVNYAIALGAVNLPKAINEAINKDKLEMIKYLLINGPIFKSQYSSLILPTNADLDNILDIITKHEDLNSLKYVLLMGSDLRALLLI